MIKIFVVLLDDYKTEVARFKTREDAEDYARSHKKHEGHYVIDVCVINNMEVNNET